MHLDDNTTPKFTWQEATDFTKNLVYAGASDWRLPTMDEFMYLVDEHASSEVKLPTGHPFRNAQPKHYWSSKTFSHAPDCAYLVDLRNTNYDSSEKARQFFVWPVRLGRAEASEFPKSSDPNQRFIDLQNRTIFDTTTQLVMMRDLEDVRKILEARELGISDQDIYAALGSVTRQNISQKRV